MVICLHLSVSNKNLLQPPACLQDFLSCLATIIFKSAEFLLEELLLLLSPLQFHPTLNYFSFYDAVLLHHRIHVTRLQTHCNLLLAIFLPPVLTSDLILKTIFIFDKCGKCNPKWCNPKCNWSWLKESYISFLRKNIAVQCISLQILIAFEVIYSLSNASLAHWEKVFWMLPVFYLHDPQSFVPHTWPSISWCYVNKECTQVFLAHINSWFVSFEHF